MRSPWKYLKYLFLFMNSSIAVLQGLLVYQNIIREDFSHFSMFLNLSLFVLFLYIGISMFRKQLNLDREWNQVNINIERILEDLTNRFETCRLDGEVNWKRDGF